MIALQGLFKYVRKLGTIEPKQRALINLLFMDQIDYFNNEFIEMNLFLENIALKDTTEKDVFLKLT